MNMKSLEQANHHRSTLDRPLNQLTDDDIVQLTREDCRRYLKQKGMRRPSWNKSQAIQQVFCLKKLLESNSDEGEGDPIEPNKERESSCLTHEGGLENPHEESKKSSNKTQSTPPCAPIITKSLLQEPSSDFNTSLGRNSFTREAAGPLTIFYSGSVYYYQNVPFDKAQAMMVLANTKSSPKSEVYKTKWVPNFHSHEPIKSRKDYVQNFLERRKIRSKTYKSANAKEASTLDLYLKVRSSLQEPNKEHTSNPMNSQRKSCKNDKGDLEFPNTQTSDSDSETSSTYSFLS